MQILKQQMQSLCTQILHQFSDERSIVKDLLVHRHMAQIHKVANGCLDNHATSLQIDAHAGNAVHNRIHVTTIVASLPVQDTNETTHNDASGPLGEGVLSLCNDLLHVLIWPRQHLGCTIAVALSHEREDTSDGL